LHSACGIKQQRSSEDSWQNADYSRSRLEEAMIYPSDALEMFSFLIAEQSFTARRAAAPLMSAMSAFGGKADITRIDQYVRL
jgi:hypothetical protein